MTHRWCWVLGAAFLLAMTACQTVEDDVAETLGEDQLPILVSRVSEGRNALAEASTQFDSVIQALSSVIDFEGDVSVLYDRLRIELSRCEDAVEDVKNRVADIHQAADELFDSWDERLGAFTDPQLHDDSASLRDEVRAAYNPVFETMARAEESMDFVLTSYRDQVMALKHDPTFDTIAAIRDDLGLLSTEIQKVIQDLSAAMDQAEAFTSAVS